ncbi:MAG: hypothetical protein RR554_04050 [Vagococcus sp.]|uniref:hypothetical protein n=1 Tax=Vagococcus sp. TaxID=1933889 RepID=UPI002FC84B42
MIQNKEIKTLDKLFDEAVNYAEENNISKIILFIKESKNILNLKQKVEGKNIQVIATTFPMNQPLYLAGEDGDIEEYNVDIFKNSEKEKLEENDIVLVSGTMPLDPVIVPGNTFNPYTSILKTFSLIGEGMDLAIQSVLMTTDAGATIPGEQVLTLNAKIILDVNTCNSRFLYHNNKGLKINQIIK